MDGERADTDRDTSNDEVDPENPQSGLYSKGDTAIAEQAMAWLKESSDALKPIREIRRTCHKFVGNDQWELDDVKRGKAMKRPTLTMNLTLSIVAAVEGEERTNRQEIKFYGGGKEDDHEAAGLTKISKHIMQTSGGEFALSQQFRETAIAGQGWVVPNVDFFDDPEGEITIDEVDEEECYPDPLARSPVYKDGRYFCRMRMMTGEEAEARFGKKKFQECVHQIVEPDEAGMESDGKGYADIYLEPDNMKSLKIHDAQKKLWGILETWWWQIEDKWVVLDPETGLREEYDDDEFEELTAQREAEQQEAVRMMMATAMAPAPQMQPLGVPAADPMMPGAELMGQPEIQIPPPIKAKKRPCRCFYQAFTCHKQVLEKQPSPLKRLKRIPYVPHSGIWDKARKTWMGIVENILDAQRQHNIEQSALTELTRLQPKQSWMAPRGSFHNKKDWQTKISQPGQMLEFNAKNGKPEQVPVQTVPRHMMEMSFSRAQAMRDISGVNVELTGQRQGSDPGVVMEMRQKQAKTVLAPLFDNFRHAKLELAKVLLAFMQAYISEGRKIRILGPEGAAHVEMTDLMRRGKYDVAVEETNSTVNDRIAALNLMQTTLPMMMKADVPITPEIIDLLPMEPTLRDSWKRQIVWEMTLAGRLPPDGWNPGDPIPLPPPQEPPVDGAPPVV